LAIIKALSAGDISADFYKQLMAAMGKKKRPLVPTRNRGTTVPQRASATGKRKDPELACARDSLEPATRRPSTGTGPASQQLQSQVATGEQAAAGGRQLGSPEGGLSYAATAAACVAPYMQSGPIMPSAKGSDPSDPAVSSETAPGRMSDDMSGPLGSKSDGTTTTAHVATNCMPASQRHNKTPIF
jgi:hypothetical protein